MYFCIPLHINLYTLLYMFGLGLQEILVIAIVVLLLFGGKKIPELMRGVGQGVRSFKEGLSGEPAQQTTQNTSDGSSPKEDSTEGVADAAGE